MVTVLEHYWFVIVFPLLGAVTNGILGRRFSPRIIGWIACAAPGMSFLLTLAVLREFLALSAEERLLTTSLFTWIESGNLRVDFSFLLDPLSLVMLLVITGVGLLIHIYSVVYMQGEDGYYRYFAYLNLFLFMMIVLVLADNYLLMFVGWEGVGLCSYLLIGFYLDRTSAGDAAKKAFIVNRIGDVGFLLGLFLIFQAFGSLHYRTVFEAVSVHFPEPAIGFGLLGAITLLLFIGATGKSAQIPLYVWLPDAMEGPTPVSALIHAATMVTAGVYMVARSAPLYSRAPETLFVIALIGLATAMLAALVAMVQSDIKKVLAYSTVSQLGYMFLAAGVGAFGASVFHLATHAFFKALLFLGSGSVILALHHQQDLWKMGGLRRYLPVTFYSMWIGTLAIAGAPFMAGFFSKDLILWEVFSQPLGGPVFWLAGVVVAGLTAFYMSRLMFLAFHGESRQASEHPPHEPSSAVKVPLIVLAVFSVVAGFIGLPGYLGRNRLQEFLEPAFRHQYRPEAGASHSHLEEILLTGFTILVSLIGLAVAHHLYVRNPGLPQRIEARFQALWQLMAHNFYVDRIYNGLLVNPLVTISRRLLWESVDIKLIDGMVNGTASWFQQWSVRFRHLQSGYARSYASWILGGALITLIYLWYLQTS